MPILRKRTKGPIKGSYKKRKSSMCENCSLLVETWYYGKLHKNTEHEVGYYYNVSEERIVEKSGGVGIGASLSGPSVEANLGATVVTTNGCPQILMFHHNESDHCYSCFKEIQPSIFRSVSISLDHTANIRDDSEDNDEEVDEDEEEDFEGEILKDDNEPEILVEKYENRMAKGVKEAWNGYNSYSQQMEDEEEKEIETSENHKAKDVTEVWKRYNGYSQQIEDEKESVEEEKEAAEERCSDNEENEKELNMEDNNEIGDD